MNSEKFWTKGNVPSPKACNKEINLSLVSSIGSCFSRNIYRWLQHNNVVETENWWGIFYNPFSILAEFRRLFGIIDWENNVILVKRDTYEQLIDPWRTWIVKGTFDEILESNKSLDMVASDQLRKSKSILITYGLVEVWKRKNVEHLYFNNLPNRVIAENKQSSEYISIIASLNEIFLAIKETILIIKENLGADVNIIITLSPVPLKFTFSDLSVREANNISKSRLLVAIYDICTIFENVFYFPSYEFVQGYSEFEYNNVWQSDNRHITAKMIDIIANNFVEFCNYEIIKSNKLFFVPCINNLGTSIGELYTDGTQILK